MDSDFDEKIRQLAAADPDYSEEAYRFVSAAVSYTAAKFRPRRHVSGAELLQGCVEFARGQYGAVARLVLREWGIECGSDIGELVFRQIAAGLLSASPEDRREDFDVPFLWFPEEELPCGMCGEVLDR